MLLKNTISLFLSFLSTGLLAQPANDACSNAERLCEGLVVSGTTANASSGTEDDSFCYTPEATVWYIFTTNASGGAVTVSFTNLSFDPDPTLGQTLNAHFFETSGGCGAAPITPMSSCGNSGTDFTINEITALAPNTTYYIQVSGSSAGATFPASCTFDISISGPAVALPNPTVSISTSTTTICMGEDIDVNITSTDCDDLVFYEWFYDGSPISSGSSNTFSTAELLADGNLSLTISCGEFCTKTASSGSLPLTIIPVSAEAGPSQLINAGEQATLTGSGTGTPSWTPGSSLTSTTTLTTIASPESTTVYYLVMENMGCYATDSTVVYVGEIITIFSAFSPNGDNVNDRWHILNSDQFPNMEVTVYDRSGQLVFSAVNYSTEDQWWDGTFKGKDLPVSSYYYVIRLNDASNKEYRGTVSIIR